MDSNNQPVPSGLPHKGDSQGDSQSPTDEVVRVKRYPVMEVFGPTIQGEGIQAGYRTGFIRFGGCDYRCQKCDSLHAVIPDLISKNAQRLTAKEITEECLKAFPPSNCTWVTFSGGNPAMHDLKELVQWLKNAGYKINVETQGTLCPEWLNFCDQVTVSPKTPGMGEKFEEAKFRRFIETVTPPLCVKVVIFSAYDLQIVEHISGIIGEIFGDSEEDGITYYLSLGNPNPPRINALGEVETGSVDIEGLLSDYRVLIEELLQNDNLKHWKFLPQIHVLAYGNQAGV